MTELKVISIEEEKFFDDIVFPLSLSPPENVTTTGETIELIKRNMSDLMDKLLKHGAILFRGFPISSPKDFNDFALAFGWDDLPYIGS